MGWSLRKSFRILPGVKLNLSKRGPRLSVGVPGARASIDLRVERDFMRERDHSVIRRLAQLERPAVPDNGRGA